MPEKYFLTILELNWNQRLGHNSKTKLNICHHMLMSSTQLQNRSFHVVERPRTSTKCQKMKNARAKRAKNTRFLYLWVFVAVVVAIALPNNECRSFRLQVVSPTGRFTYMNSIPLHT